MNIYINGKQIRLKASQAIGKGGEADVYKLGHNRAIKIFKSPDHPDYQGLSQERRSARERLLEHQQKLRQFPTNLPSRVVTPETLVTDKQGKTIKGYTMPLVENAEVLLHYGERGFRSGTIDNKTVQEIFQDLHQTLTKIHTIGVIIGDFNDLNVLVKGTDAYLIDADSFQFNGFYCHVFTAKFVDPLLCDRAASSPIMQSYHNQDSDWYSFSVMLMQCLLFVSPYGGIYKPKKPSQQIPQAARSLNRITIFNPEVKYPKPATPYQVLSDDLLHHFYQVFEEDKRIKFPRSLLDCLHWQKCPSCGVEHARKNCPLCTNLHVIPSISPIGTKTVRGTVTAELIFQTEGIIIAANGSQFSLQWLYWDNGEFKRENNAVVLTGKLDPYTRFRLQGKATLVGKQGQVITLDPDTFPDRLAVDNCGKQVQFDTNAIARYWLYNGQLLRDGKLGAEYIGDVLNNQTRFWVGSQFGFGFYRAGNLTVSFVFDARGKGINDRLQIPFGSGRLLDADCAFSDRFCWFFWSMQERGKTIQHCALITSDGRVQALHAGDEPWLQNLQGKCAIAHFLLCGTDAGIVRVEVNDDRLFVAKEFPNTEPFVDANTHLFPSTNGLYGVSQQTIYLLKMS
ncbi:MAG: hypothetical protein J7647_24730 [Cyanobacteria bacterium SBLK]|nr:hypothetical protein [Cyanobacteria bacterium SBLK]